MFLDDELEAAGRRAAHRPVADPLPLGELEQEVQRRRNNRRFAGAASITAMLLLGGVGAMFASLADDVQVVSAAPAPSIAGEQHAANNFAADSAGDSSPEPAAPASESSSGGDTSSDESRSSGKYHFDSDSGDASVRWGEWWTGVEYAVGDEADTKAAEAAAEADEARAVDSKQVWIDRYQDENGVDAVSVSSFSEGKFVKLSGPATIEEQLIALVIDEHHDDHYEKWAEHGEKWEEYAEEWAEQAEKWEEYGKEWAEYGEKWADWAEKFANEWGDYGPLDEFSDRDRHFEDWDDLFEDREERLEDWDDLFEDREERFEDWDDLFEKWEEQAEKWEEREGRGASSD